MAALLSIIHILACVILILIVLLQAGKGANMGAAFGGSSQTVFGSSGAGTFLGKVTAAVAIIFMLTSISLTYTVTKRSTSSLMEKVPAPISQPAPVVPMPDAPAATPGAAPAAPSAAAPTAQPATGAK